jgi:hypothetical protein
MELGELVATMFLESQVEEECPFQFDMEGEVDKEDEDIADDDVTDPQENDASKLGTNLKQNRSGAPGTADGPFEFPGGLSKNPQYDTKNKGTKKRAGDKVLVLGTGVADDVPDCKVEDGIGVKSGPYPFQTAAHHLIPGNASLYNGDCDLWNYMEKDKTIEAAGFTWTIKFNIGYNVNGNHNGVWLPGNYGLIKDGAEDSPTKETWSALEQDHADWQLHYVAACSKALNGQFHDEHSKYNDKVRDLLNLIAEILFFHQTICKQCHGKFEKIPPPFIIKTRLYNISAYLKRRVTGNPQGWVRPWFTSNRWRDDVFGNGARPRHEFVDAYDYARIVEAGSK